MIYLIIALLYLGGWALGYAVYKKSFMEEDPPSFHRSFGWTRQEKRIALWVSFFWWAYLFYKLSDYVLDKITDLDDRPAKW